MTFMDHWWCSDLNYLKFLIGSTVTKVSCPNKYIMPFLYITLKYNPAAMKKNKPHWQLGRVWYNYISPQYFQEQNMITASRSTKFILSKF